MESPKDMLTRFLEESRLRREYEDRMAMRLVQAIRSRDMSLVRTVLDERLEAADYVGGDDDPDDDGHGLHGLHGQGPESAGTPVADAVEPGTTGGVDGGGGIPGTEELP